MKTTITFIFCFFLSYLVKADTIPSWKVFHNSKLLKEMKFTSEIEEIKIDTQNCKKEDNLYILYDNLKVSEDYIYDITLESESSVDINFKYRNGESGKLRTENSVELYFGRINDKSKPIRVSFEWIIDWLKEYPQYRIQVVLVESNRKEKIYNKTKLFYIVNK